MLGDNILLLSRSYVGLIIILQYATFTCFLPVNMGLCQSAEAVENQKRNAEIDTKIRREKDALRNEVKMLLLGAGESGKSTILKQMKLIHGTSLANTLSCWTLLTLISYFS